MYHKIYISVIIILASLLSWSTYNFTVSSNELKDDSLSLRQLMASEKEVPSPNGKSIKACNVRVNDKETNRLITAHRFIFSKDKTCPALPGDYYISKEEYIKELQNNKGWGIFDDDYVYPDMIPADIKQTNQSSSNSSK
jgi:hypothetical protein